MLKVVQAEIFGKKRFQRFFEKLFYISKFGRNIGLPVHIESSGEIPFIKFLNKKFKSREQVVFFDIGANHGIYTEKVLQSLSSKNNVRCYLFEPQELLYDKLCRTFSANSNITVTNKGCGSKPEHLKLYSFNDIDTLASLYNTFRGTVTSETYTIVDIICLDDFFWEHSIPFIDFIKIDVEGHELEVLKGMQRYLAQRKIEVIQFEFGSFNLISRTFFKDFWELLNKHYNIYRILKNGLKHIKNYSPDLEIFDTTNYAVILK